MRDGGGETADPRFRGGPASNQRTELVFKDDGVSPKGGFRLWKPRAIRALAAPPHVECNVSPIADIVPGKADK